MHAEPQRQQLRSGQVAIPAPSDQQPQKAESVLLGGFVASPAAMQSTTEIAEVVTGHAESKHPPHRAITDPDVFEASLRAPTHTIILLRPFQILQAKRLLRRTAAPRARCVPEQCVSRAIARLRNDAMRAQPLRRRQYRAPAVSIVPMEAFVPVEGGKVAQKARAVASTPWVSGGYKGPRPR